MNNKKAARHSGNCERAYNGRLTDSIVSNREMLRLVGMTAIFTLSMLAIPTAMAILKQWGVW